MNYKYFPGCTLYTQGKTFDDAGRKSAEKLGFELEELENWTCCGATFPLSENYDMALASPVRTLTNAKKESDTLVTLCAICHNVLKRSNHLMATDKERRDKINSFIEEPDANKAAAKEANTDEATIEEDYKGELKVLHYLEVLRDELGFDAVKEKIENNLNGLKVGSYYGCMLLRPESELAMDDHYRPKIFEELVSAMGGEPVDFPLKTQCCGAFQVIHEENFAMTSSREIIDSARGRGAKLLITACPLCQFNIEEKQREMKEVEPSFTPMPVLYFTELLALSLGLGEESIDLSKHYTDPRPILREHSLLNEENSKETGS
jgi:heterodisulfide reductase subunit B